MFVLLFLAFFMCAFTGHVASLEDASATAANYNFKAPTKIDNGIWQSENLDQNITLTMEKLDQDKKKQWIEFSEMLTRHCCDYLTKEEFKIAIERKRCFSYSNYDERMTALKKLEAAQNEAPLQKIKATVNALRHAQSSLEIDDFYYKNGCVWMAYVSSSAFKEEADKKKHVEMFVTVTIEPEAFSQHMGILRNPLYEGAFHGALSLPLHSFAAKVAMAEHSSLRLFMTDPLKKMRDLFLSAMALTEEAMRVHVGLLIQPVDAKEYAYKIYSNLEEGRLKKEGHQLKLPSWLGRISFACPLSQVVTLSPCFEE